MTDRPRGGGGPTKVVLATHNAKKLAELRRIVAEAAPAVTVLGLSDLPPYPEPAETELTFEGNALLKARACVAATGLAALADDSGLCVDVLNQMPGVRSARWAGPPLADHRATDAANNELLLRQLSDVADERRGAVFVSVMALVLPDGRSHLRRGEMPGRLTRELRGENGFGYDAMFVPEGAQLTTAELSAAGKDAVSHRGKAVRAIVAVLLTELGLDRT